MAMLGLCRRVQASCCSGQEAALQLQWGLLTAVASHCGGVQAPSTGSAAAAHRPSGPTAGRIFLD